MNTRQLIINILLIFAVSVYLQAKAEVNSPLQVNFKSSSVVRNKKIITLQDLVEPRSTPKLLFKKFGRVQLGDAPRRGESRVFTNQSISQAIRENRLASNDLRFKIPSEVKIRNPKEMITQSELIQALNKKWQEQCQSCVFKIKNISKPVLNETKISEWSIDGDHKLPRGHFNLPLNVVSPERSATYWLSGQVEVYRKVPVAKKLIPLHQQIQDQDLDFKLRNVTFLFNKGFASKSDLIGRRAKRTIAGEQIVWVNDVQRPKALKKGDIVDVVVGGQNWSVNLKGLALEDGYVGDLVKLRNLKTDKLFSAKVTGMGEAEVK